MNGKMNNNIKVEGSGDWGDEKVREGKMKRQNKERWKVILRLRVVGRWKDKGIRKVGESAIIKKKM